jgi:tellurite resistance protein TehA-like permease
MALFLLSKVDIQGYDRRRNLYTWLVLLFRSSFFFFAFRVIQLVKAKRHRFGDVFLSFVIPSVGILIVYLFASRHHHNG